MYMVNTTPPITTGYVPSYHPGGTTAVQEVTRTVGSWMPTKELPQACQTCTHTWEENSVTRYVTSVVFALLTYLDYIAHGVNSQPVQFVLRTI